MQTCMQCGSIFPTVVVLGGTRLDLRGRKRCLACLPHRPLVRPRKGVIRAILQKRCDACGQAFPGRLVIGDRLRYLYRRRFCLSCSPFGMHNTSKAAPGAVPEAERVEYRRRKRNAKTYRSLKRRRKLRKMQLIAERGGRCQDCGYAACIAALEFHHRDRATKLFEVGQFNGSLGRLRAEAQKCDLLCANCHRQRHADEDRNLLHPKEATVRRQLKQRAVEYMGGFCVGVHAYDPGPGHRYDPPGVVDSRS